MPHDYIRDGAAIYRRSFAMIRQETDLTRFSADEARIAVRVIHACGMVEIVDDLLFSADFVVAATSALAGGAAIFCDSEMVAHGITKARLPAENPVLCTLRAAETPALAEKFHMTRSAAALELWGARLAGSVVVIGNAPTALFRLLELLEAGAPKPAAIVGMPVGFVGAAESKAALAKQTLIPWVIVQGRKGGSAMASAAINALASAQE